MSQGQLFDRLPSERSGNQLWVARILRGASIANCARGAGWSPEQWRMLELAPSASLKPLQKTLSAQLGFGRAWWCSAPPEPALTASDATAVRSAPTVAAIACAIAHLDRHIGGRTDTAPERPEGRTGRDRADWMIERWQTSRSLYRTTADLGYRLWALGTARQPPLWLHTAGEGFDLIATTSHPNPAIHHQALLDALTHLHTADLPDADRHDYQSRLRSATTRPPRESTTSARPMNVHYLTEPSPTTGAIQHWDHADQTIPPLQDLTRQTGIPLDLLSLMTLSCQAIPTAIHQRNQ